jgi:hypothetical protein
MIMDEPNAQRSIPFSTTQRPRQNAHSLFVMLSPAAAGRHLLLYLRDSSTSLRDARNDRGRVQDLAVSI